MTGDQPAETLEDQPPNPISVALRSIANGTALITQAERKIMRQAADLIEGGAATRASSSPSRRRSSTSMRPTD